MVMAITERIDKRELYNMCFLNLCPRYVLRGSPAAMTLWPGNNGDCGYVRGCIGKAVEAHLAVGLNCQRANPKGPLGAPGGV